MFVLCNIKTSLQDQLKIKVIMGSVPLDPTHPPHPHIGFDIFILCCKCNGTECQSVLSVLDRSAKFAASL